MTAHFRVAIIGTGFGGLGMAVRLQREGVRDFVLFERADDVGGVWRENVYPGCACDVQSHLYSLSFAPNPDWSRTYSQQPEILAYLRGVAERFGLRAHCRFGHAVKESRWDAARGRWTIETSRGPFTADILVSAVGGLSEPSIPELPGLSSFEGKVMHTARWDADFDLRGRDVAVVGTGASAIQLIPKLQPQVRRLTVFQRTPAWVMPRNDRAVGERAKSLYRRVPAAQRAVRAALYATREALVLGFLHPSVAKRGERLALRHLRAQVPDPALRAKLTPSYTLGCKRVLVSDDYYPAMTQPNVTLVAQSVREVRPHSVVAADGSEHRVDTLVFGTGFHVTDMPIARQVRGRDGRTLEDVWKGSPKAFMGTTVAGFPNLFLLQGPNTGLGHTSVIVMMESQMEHVVGALRFLDSTGALAVEPKPEAQARFVTSVDRDMAQTVWMTGGCRSWYLDGTGRNSTLWPGSTLSFRRQAERFDPADYVALDGRREISKVAQEVHGG